MAHFLIADDEAGIRRNFRLLLESKGHTCIEASDRPGTIKAARASISGTSEPFDLILLDYSFGDGTTGLDVMEKLGLDYCDHRVIVLTGSRQQGLSSEFTRLGAINYLLKPISSDQFWVTIESALTRRELFVNKREDWEAALDLLDRVGVLEGIETYNTVNQQLASQLESLKVINNELQAELRQAGQREEAVARAYEKASEALSTVPGNINIIAGSLQSFSFTEPFLSDIERLFDKDRLQFYVLASYLKRIEMHPDYPYRVLAGRAADHAEYRVGRSYRLYFRRDDAGEIVLERFGHKTVQERIIDYLSQSHDEVMEWNGKEVFPAKVAMA